MATNTPEYMRAYRANRRAAAVGFNIELARRLHRELLARGISKSDARWCVLDAAHRGIFGYVPNSSGR